MGTGWSCMTADVVQGSRINASQAFMELNSDHQKQKQKQKQQHQVNTDQRNPYEVLSAGTTNSNGNSQVSNATLSAMFSQNNSLSSTTDDKVRRSSVCRSFVRRTARAEHYNAVSATLNLYHTDSTHSLNNQSPAALHSLPSLMPPSSTPPPPFPATPRSEDTVLPGSAVSSSSSSSPSGRSGPPGPPARTFASFLSEPLIQAPFEDAMSKFTKTGFRQLLATSEALQQEYVSVPESVNRVVNSENRYESVTEMSAMLQEQNQLLQLYQLILTSSFQFSIDEFAQYVLQLVQALLGVEFGALLVIDEVNRRVFCHTTPYPDEDWSDLNRFEPDEWSYPLSPSLCAMVATTGLNQKQDTRRHDTALTLRTIPASNILNVANIYKEKPFNAEVDLVADDDDYFNAHDKLTAHSDKELSSLRDRSIREDPELEDDDKQQEEDLLRSPINQASYRLEGYGSLPHTAPSHSTPASSPHTATPSSIASSSPFSPTVTFLSSNDERDDVDLHSHLNKGPGNSSGAVVVREGARSRARSLSRGHSHSRLRRIRDDEEIEITASPHRANITATDKQTSSSPYVDLLPALGRSKSAATTDGSGASAATGSGVGVNSTYAIGGKGAATKRPKKFMCVPVRDRKGNVFAVLQVSGVERIHHKVNASIHGAHLPNGGAGGGPGSGTKEKENALPQEEEGPFSRHELALLCCLANVVGTFLILEFDKQAKQFNDMLVDAIEAISAEVEQEVLLQTVVTITQRCVKADDVVLMFVDPYKKEVEVKCTSKSHHQRRGSLSSSPNGILPSLGVKAEYEVGDRGSISSSPSSIINVVVNRQQAVNIRRYSESVFYRDSRGGDSANHYRKHSFQAQDIKYVNGRSVLSESEKRRSSDTTLAVASLKLRAKPIQSILAIPLLDQNGNTIAVIQCVNKQPSKKQLTHGGNAYFSAQDERLLHYIARQTSASLKRSNEYERARKAQRRNQALLTIVKTCANANEEVDLVIESIINACYQMLEADRVTLFLLDELRQEFWARISKDVEGFRVPFGAGVVGRVASTGEPMNIHDAYQCEFFNPSVDKKTKYRTRTILCMPIKDTRGKVIAVLQAINKLRGVFSDTDEDLLSAVIREISGVVKRKSTEAAFFRVMSDKRDSSAKAMLSLYTHHARRSIVGTDAKTKQQIVAASDAVTAAADAAASAAGSAQINISTTTAVPRADGTAVVPILDSPSWFMDPVKLQSWEFDPFVYSAEQLMLAIHDIFNYFNMLSMYQVPVDKFNNFITAVRANYRDNQYHNFVHGFGVLHGTFMILSTSHANEYLKPLEIFGSLIASLCHDLDHPGFNNAFLIATRAEFATLYNDVSVLENHHAASTFQLVYHDDKNIFEALTPQQITDIRKIIIKSILATDMTEHMTLTTTCQKYASTDLKLNKENAADRQLICNIVVHSSDINNPVLPTTVHIKWTDACIEEFYSQAQAEKARGLPVTPFMASKDDLSKAKVNLNFLEYVVSPLWCALVEIFPGLAPRMEDMKKNREYHMAVLERLEPKKKPALAAPAPAGAAAASIGPTGPQPDGVHTGGDADVITDPIKHPPPLPLDTSKDHADEHDLIALSPKIHQKLPPPDSEWDLRPSQMLRQPSARSIGLIGFGASLSMTLGVTTASALGQALHGSSSSSSSASPSPSTSGSSTPTMHALRLTTSNSSNSSYGSSLHRVVLPSLNRVQSLQPQPLHSLPPSSSSFSSSASQLNISVTPAPIAPADLLRSADFTSFAVTTT